MSSKTGEEGIGRNEKKKEESSGLFSSTTSHEKGGRKLREGNKQRAVEQIGHDEQGVSLSKSNKVWRKNLRIRGKEECELKLMILIK
jgi:hypothetical protein